MNTPKNTRVSASGSGQKRFGLIIFAAALLALIIIGVFVWHQNTRQTAKTPLKNVTKSTGNSSTKGEPAQISEPVANANSGNSGSSNDKSTQTASGQLVTPSGNFVSNHRPNLSGSPAPNQVSSACNTTPGAACQITFTKGDLVKSLATQTTDASGATYWSWNLQDVGLTAGSWQVQAIATLNGKNLTVKDAMNLEVAE